MHSLKVDRVVDSYVDARCACSLREQSVEYLLWVRDEKPTILL